MRKRTYIHLICFVALAIGIAYLIDTEHQPVNSDAKISLKTKVKSFDEHTWTLDDIKKRPLIVNFWATWCEPCALETPELVALFERMGNNIAVVGLVVDSPTKQVANFVRRYRTPYPIAQVKTDVLTQWNIATLPATFVFDETDTVIWSKHGQLLQQDFIELENALRRSP